MMVNSANRPMVQDPTGPPGQLYQGQLEGRMKSGTGILHFEVPEIEGVVVFEGNFCQNTKHGHGVMEWPDGRKYCGQFLNDEFHGEGTMIWPDGHKYVGHYAHGKKEGQGTLTNPGGSKFIGQFCQGKRHGEFLYIKADSTTTTLHFSMDKVCQTVNPILSRQPTPTVSDCATDVTSASGSTECSEKDLKRRGPSHSSPDTWRVVDPGGAVVRFSNSLRSKKVGLLRRKEELTVVKEEGRRLRVVSPIEGWVSKSTEDGLTIMVRVD